MISRGFAGLPPYGPGQRIGLFGGSFNPPHAAHRMASLLALRRLQLDWVWWLISPGNPLKDTRDLPSIDERLEKARHAAAHPRIAISAYERTLGSPYTCDLIATLARRCHSAHFVLLMGADSFADLHRWKRWRSIVEAVPLGVIDRPGATQSASRSRAASVIGARRLKETEASHLVLTDAPAYVFLHGRRSALSSTAIRDRTAPTTSL